MESGRKDLGQYYTPWPVAAVACSAAIRPEDKRIIDPMAGTGRMLAAAKQRLEMLGSPTSDLAAIEIDQGLARSLPQDFQTWAEDAFAVSSSVWQPLPIMRESFDVVVGNPPYVRYQDLPAVKSVMNDGLRRLVREARPRLSTSQVAQLAIRVALVSEPARDEETSVTNALQLLSAHRDSGLQSSATSIWNDLVGSYGGQSDLSVPSWLLVWKLLRPGGRVAFVTTEAWRTRAYGSLLKYFMARLFKPIVVVEQSGARWFGSTQIRASLVVLEKLGPEDAMRPVGGRDSTLFPVVTLGGDLRLDDDEHLRRFGGSMTRVPQAVAAERAFDAFMTQDQVDLYERDWLSTGDLVTEAMSQGSRTAASLIERWEGTVTQPTHSNVAKRRYPVPAFPFLSAKERLSYENFIALEDIGVRVHQGLRTGYNPFFYVRASEPKDGMVDITSLNGDSVTFSVPARYIRKVIRRQGRIAGWALEDSSSECSVVTTCGGMTGYEIEDLEQTYPASWLAGWRDEYDLHELPAGLTSYIEWGESLTISRGGETVQIRDLSAVAPNRHRPSSREGDLPEPPRGWYALPLKVRHEARIIVPRVVGRIAAAYLNREAGPFVIDANFSTIALDDTSLTPIALVAMLNSSWCRAMYETTGTPMGGGALKLEATHLRRIAIPVLAESEIHDLTEAGRALLEANQASDPLIDVDRIVGNAAARTLQWKPSRLTESLEQVLKSGLTRRTAA